ncbi:2-succinyl-5-enolpyruvyl-6-hydroxy-3-cyclohexene-1-carboxylic-acid synthase [Echinicola marina]|uniref:2-succinyl-5-enolpyruvyl-6-hydroxy-3- cyclohexene-1-carboxylic-acid synthase n=1 Tax=Echinicola marina TaxID=2859768 RepID=UPI001CF69BEA|nr:2-succinyl-5-enolpyruvyl-6-hydroxy-3-cyclohexene-1-carboxylic-acid synthase [Echinicola marina]UCS95636.1 2-succinyl-5-enolpyruvyl-6-hydroxy-3-cyclohexene-1-carboxylic-acid synthase [Echinicola marina]
MIIQPLIDLANICAKKGVNNIILSPGSRCAPITLAFARHPDLHCRTISDERSAAFIALGMAQQLKKPVVLVCTSGTAALNYAPAVAEAFFQQIPLIVITADRPNEWIDQWDGQTIRQEKIYGRHIKKDYCFPDDFSHKDKIWHANRISNEACNLAQSFPAGPVHINIPLREPFYPTENEKFDYGIPVRVVEQISAEMILSDEALIKLKTQLHSYDKIIIVPGQQLPNKALQELLDNISKAKQAIIVTDTISNLQSEHTINYHDQLIPLIDKNALKPDLIISFGKSIISKALKLFLRESNADHWHIQAGGEVPDTYQGLSKQIYCGTPQFLKFIHSYLGETNTSFYQTWYDANKVLETKITNALEGIDFGEFKAIYEVLKHIPHNSKLHLANSMSVRYVNFLGPRKQEIICNRGTSGIDGSNSTAVGCTFTTKDFVTLITGDLAFFYDRNAFWHNYPFNNLRIILLNNQAGGIFRLIDGPSKQAELEEFFETKQSLQAENLAKDFNFKYYTAKDEIELENALEDFYHPSIRPKILEVKSESVKNAEILKTFKKMLK